MICLSKVGEVVHIESYPEKLLLRTTSPTQSAYAKFTFPTCFFKEVNGSDLISIVLNDNSNNNSSNNNASMDDAHNASNNNNNNSILLSKCCVLSKTLFTVFKQCLYGELDLDSCTLCIPFSNDEDNANTNDSGMDIDDNNR